MADEFQEITTTSWGKRIMGSFMGILFGVVFFVAAFPLIFWNEGRSVDRIKTLDEGKGLVISVPSATVDAAHESALIHTSGNATTEEILKDEPFGIQEKALKLKRTVEMYQWKETKHSQTDQNMGGTETTKTTYSYDKIWSEDMIDSSDFKKQDGHQNPGNMPYISRVFSAFIIKLGAFRLGPTFIEQMNHFEPYTLSKANADAMDKDLKKTFKLIGNSYYSGDAENPKVGTMRISYEIIKPSQISVVGQQEGDCIQNYFSRNGDIDFLRTDNVGISLLQTGNVGVDAMFAAAQSENTVITWLIRLGAFVLMWVGMAMVFGPIKVLGDVVPLIGSLLGAGIGLVTGVISLALSLITVAIAWIVFRPLIGVALLVLAAAFFFGGFRMIKAKLQKPQAA